MLTFEQALAIARKKKDKINHCVEYSNAYMFEYDSGIETDGGESPIVVMKAGGQTMGFTAYAWMPGKEYVGEREVK